MLLMGVAAYNNKYPCSAMLQAWPLCYSHSQFRVSTLHSVSSNCYKKAGLIEQIMFCDGYFL